MLKLVHYDPYIFALFNMSEKVWILFLSEKIEKIRRSFIILRISLCMANQSPNFLFYLIRIDKLTSCVVNN